MISDQQQEQAGLYVLGALPAGEAAAFERELAASAELRQLVAALQRTTVSLAAAAPQVAPPPALRAKVLGRIEAQLAAKAPPPSAVAALAGLRFLNHADATGWKQLPIPGAWIKLLSLERDRGYAVLLGRLAPGVRYPAHRNAGPEDFVILTGDLHVSGRRLGPGDFHHADGGSEHGENFSEEGCTLVAVLTTDDPLVAFALG